MAIGFHMNGKAFYVLHISAHMSLGDWVWETLIENVSE